MLSVEKNELSGRIYYIPLYIIVFFLDLRDFQESAESSLSRFLSSYLKKLARFRSTLLRDQTLPDRAKVRGLTGELGLEKLNLTGDIEMFLFRRLRNLIYTMNKCAGRAGL